jgi:hypothetical protein
MDVEKEKKRANDFEAEHLLFLAKRKQPNVGSSSVRLTSNLQSELDAAVEKIKQMQK